MQRSYHKVAALVVTALAACQPADRTETAETETAEAAPEVGVVEVTAREYAFEAPAEIPSGWTTFRMVNAGEQEHFLALWPLPDDRTFDDYVEEILGTFETLGAQYAAGEIDRPTFLEQLGGQLPEWFPSAIQGAGGPGLTSPGRTSQATVYLEPGNYVMECYVRSPDGQYHSMLGMIRPLAVTEQPSGGPEPETDVQMTLSNYSIETVGDLTAGEHTLRVEVADTPEGLLTHDVHLARLDEVTSPDDVVGWMDFLDRMKAPAPAEFLGGIEHMPAGSVGYFTVELEPGRYLWVSEGYGAQGMVKEFTVP